MRIPFMLSAAILVLAACSDEIGNSQDGPEAGAVPADSRTDPPAPDNVVDALAPYYAQLGLTHPQAPPGAPDLSPDTVLTRIVFGSCHSADQDMSILDTIIADTPQLVIYGGDNVYGDGWSLDPTLPELRAAYAELAATPEFVRLRQAAPMLAVWDDHDYGMNDMGRNYPYRGYSESLFLDFWRAPPDDVRRSRPGIYDARIFGPEGRRTQIILLDTRYFRSDLTASPERGAPGRERYIPSQADGQDMLGDTQWRWLEEQLRQPADLRLLVSSIQVHADGHGWEAWRTLPAERERLYALIGETGAQGVVIISGDRHFAGLYRRADVAPYPLYEMTSSSLNLAIREVNDEPGPHRIGDMYGPVNYGVIGVDWEAGTVTLSIRGLDGAVVREVVVAMDDLRAD